MHFKEDFLHFVWQYKLFESRHLETTDQQAIVIKHVGHYTQLSGPDFSEAQIYIDQQLWVGSLEIHKKSSEWYDHQHHLDPAYDNVILHVVWDDDQVVFDKHNQPLTTLCIKPYVSKILIQKYQQLMADKSWIFCENQLKNIPEINRIQAFENLFVERLSQKMMPYENLLKTLHGDWEHLLFVFLMKAFGLNINGEVFFDMGKKISFDWIKKERHDLTSLEALLFGQTQILKTNFQDNYFSQLKKTYTFLKNKYQINELIHQVHFYKLRPDNFPTIRLSQLAQIYHQEAHVFELLIKSNMDLSRKFLRKIMPSIYWQTHYVFDKTVNHRQHQLSDNFIDLLFINVILPIKYFYYQNQGKDLADEIIVQYSQMKKENNQVIKKFESFGLPIKDALDTQAAIQLKKHYCDHRLCLNCHFGKFFMGKN